mmetsp:Transcript_26007/g.77118  ORF Transcript_26007/g.77118 Transcript_26007/m.77118 type:complete len:81 (+) Transcript_26007:2631-2873(+)
MIYASPFVSHTKKLPHYSAKIQAMNVHRFCQEGNTTFIPFICQPFRRRFISCQVLLVRGAMEQKRQTQSAQPEEAAEAAL